MQVLRQTTAAYTAYMGLIDRIRRLVAPKADSKPNLTIRPPEHSAPPRRSAEDLQALRHRDGNTPHERQTVQLGPVTRFPELPTRRIKIVGMSNYCTDTYRRSSHPSKVVIQAEPTNPVDLNAITIATRKGKRLGYMAAGTAKQYHQVVASISAIEVACTQDGLKWWMEVPTLPSLRKAAQHKE